MFYLCCGITEQLPTVAVSHYVTLTLMQHSILHDVVFGVWHDANRHLELLSACRQGRPTLKPAVLVVLSGLIAPLLKSFEFSTTRLNHKLSRSHSLLDLVFIFFYLTRPPTPINLAIALSIIAFAFGQSTNNVPAITTKPSQAARQAHDTPEGGRASGRLKQQGRY